MNKTTLLLSLALSTLAMAEEPPDVMLTDSGKVSLHHYPCPFQDNKGFIWAADASEGINPGRGVYKYTLHLGCWRKEGTTVKIWFYQEPDDGLGDLVAPFKESYFKKEQQ